MLSLLFLFVMLAGFSLGWDCGSAVDTGEKHE